MAPPTAAGVAAAVAAGASVNGAAPAETLRALGVQAPKLFIGQLPFTMGEAQAKALFEPYGRIFDFKLLINLRTGQSKGAGFVTFFEKASADAAMAALNGKVTLPGMGAPMVVRPAERKQATGNTKLFLSQLPPDVTEQTLRPYFEKFATIEDIVILRHNDTGNSKGYVPTFRTASLRVTSLAHDDTICYFSDTSCLSAFAR